MSKNKYYLLTGLVGLLVTTALIGSVSSAHWGVNIEKNQEIKQMHQEVRNAFDNNDYNTWQEMMNDKADNLCDKAEEMRGNITQENFDKMIKAHELMQDGNKEEAIEIMKELGFGGYGFGFGFGMKPGFRGHMFNK